MVCRRFDGDDRYLEETTPFSRFFVVIDPIVFLRPFCFLGGLPVVLFIDFRSCVEICEF